MYCIKCGCEMPAIARYCCDCGSEMYTEGIILLNEVHVEEQTPAAPTRSVPCLNCSHSYAFDLDECPSCGLFNSRKYVWLNLHARRNETASDPETTGLLSGFSACLDNPSNRVYLSIAVIVMVTVAISLMVR